ncbi:MAG TPA: 16S rRNA (uracil(1498)-N(3))-methyltransferase [Candidatus Ozemobacteraceae bacterium]|nr:16S rRNA (uracil(1498)-N(3))-methyltransferase [Candidatus Ozemobacteraceae bacterium]
MTKTHDRRRVPDARVYEPDFDGVLSEANMHYLERVLRLVPGDRFCVTDGRGREGWSEFSADGALLVREIQEPDRDCRWRVTLFAGLTKGDRFEWLLEKAVELGVTCVVPLVSARCVVRELSAAKLDRYRKIALAAMLQSGGCWLPRIEDPQPVAHLAEPHGNVCGWLLHEGFGGGGSLPAVETNHDEIWVCSGPEGGFTESEVETLLARGWRGVSLGPRRLRAETAPLVAVSALLLTRA